MAAGSDWRAYVNALEQSRPMVGGREQRKNSVNHFSVLGEKYSWTHTIQVLRKKVSAEKLA